MSTNHLPLELPPPSAWKLPVEQHAGNFVPQHHRHLHQQQLLHEGNYVRELLFEKPLTPSDVGKLNRLVIPKQHAERYFPLDGDCGEKGLLLSFEDESGKTWEFRYSYWTSSQSYVLTKGWSRFVKDKGLDAGDVVLFERRRSVGHRLCIGWKRRGELARLQDDRGTHTGVNAVAARRNPVYDAHAAPSPTQHNLPTPTEPYAYSAVVEQQEDPLMAAGEHAVRKASRSPPAAGTSSRRLRLFGVNLECGPEQEPEPHMP